MPKKGSPDTGGSTRIYPEMPPPRPEGGIEPLRAPVWHPNRTLLAVDPGEVHVGIAEFQEHDTEWECLRAYELGWLEAADYIAGRLVEDPPDLLVVETFQLYASMATDLIGSQMETSQLIGVIKYLHSCQDRRRERASRDEDGKLRFEGLGDPERKRVELIFQPASIQKATSAILNAKGVESEARGNDHARSAELHGWHRILRENV